MKQHFQQSSVTSQKTGFPNYTAVKISTVTQQSNLQWL